MPSTADAPRAATGATSCWASRRRCSPSAASATPRCATSPTPPGSCPASLYHHFDSKESMVDELLRHLPGRAVRRRTTRSWPSDRTPRQKLEAVVGRRSRRSTSTTARWRSSRTTRRTSPASTGSPTSSSATRSSATLWRGLLQRGRRRRGAARTTSTSTSSTASCATPSGSPCAGTAPVARSPPSQVADQYLSHPAGRESPMPEAYIVDAVRTPVGKRGGSLAGVHSADLGAHVLSALVERTGVDPGAVDDVIMGCCDTIGSQAGDVARTAWLVAGTARPRAGRDHRPPVRVLAAGGALRRAGRACPAPRTSSSPAACRTCPRSRSRRRCSSASSTASPRRSPSRPAGRRATATRRSPSSARPR